MISADALVFNAPDRGDAAGGAQVYDVGGFDNLNGRFHLLRWKVPVARAVSAMFDAARPAEKSAEVLLLKKPV